MLTAIGYGSEKTSFKGDAVVTQEALDFDNPLFDSRKLSFDGRKHESLSNQQVSINPLTRKGTLQRALSNKGGLGVSSRVHSASAGSLTSLDLNNATVMSSDEFKRLVQGLKSTEENAAILARVRLCTSNKLFTSDQLVQLLDVTTSIKTQIEMISILAPNLIDPKAKFDQFVGKYRFIEDKDKVTEYLTDATKKLSSLRYSRHTNLNVRQSRFGSTDSLSDKLVDNNTQRSRFASTDSANINNNNNNNNNKSGSFYSNGLGSPTSPDSRPGVTQLDRELYKIDDSYREDSLQSIDCNVLLSPRTNDESDKKATVGAVVGDTSSSSTEMMIIDRPSVADVKKRISVKLHSSGNAHLLSPQKNLATSSSPRPVGTTAASDSVKSSTSTKGGSSISSLSPRPISANIQNNNNNANNSSSKNSIKTASITPLVPIKEVTSPKSSAVANNSNNSKNNDAKNREELKRSSSEGTTTTAASVHSDSTATTVPVATTGGTNSKPSSPSSSPKRVPFLSKLKSTFSPSTRKNTSTTTAQEPSSSSSVVIEVRRESPTKTDNTTTPTSTVIDANNSDTKIRSQTPISENIDGLLQYDGLLLSKVGWVTKSWCVYRVKIHGTVLTLYEENNHKKGNSSVEYELHPSVCTQLIIHCDVLRVLNKTQGINEMKISGLMNKSNSHGITAAMKKDLVVFRSVHTGYDESLQDLYQWKDYLLKANSSINECSNGTS